MSRSKILQIFKDLHRAAQRAFDGDARTLEGARQRINEEFRKELNADDKIDKKLKTAEDVVLVLDKQVVQLERNPETENFSEWWSLRIEKIDEFHE